MCFANKDLSKVIEIIADSSAKAESQNLSYKRLQLFDEISEHIYIIDCGWYIDKDGKPLDDETSIKHLIDGEPINDDIEVFGENGDVVDYMDYDDIYCKIDNKYDLRKITW